MNSYVLGFQEIDKSKLKEVGGKGANLGELARIDGISVPEGFCITTAAYKKAVEDNQEFNEALLQLSRLKLNESEKISEISGKIRMVIEKATISNEIKEQIDQYITQFGENNAFAIRSSATAEDLPTASFAGQQDTYLNIMGLDSVLQSISKCWASLFTDRAVIYRMQNGFDHQKVHLSVVVQKMVFPEAAGIMFTADPLSSNRKVLTIDASFGLGEALVSGLVNADIYKVREGRIVDKKISTKKLAIYALEAGGTRERELDLHKQNLQTLNDQQILQLETLGRKIEAYFGSPQDIEWALVRGHSSEGGVSPFPDTFYILQSRPITTLYPVPDAADDKCHVYMSVGHSQMMTDAMKLLGLSFFKLLGTEEVAMDQAGGRFYFDLSHDMASPVGRKIVLGTMGNADLMVKNALLTLMKRKDFIKSLARGKRTMKLGNEYFSWGLPIIALKIYRQNDPAIVQTLMSRNEASINNLREKIVKLSGDQLFAYIVDDHKKLKETMYNSQSVSIIMIALYAMSWINKHMEKWLGEKNTADTLSQSVDNNVTSEMGLALLDVADVVRQHPAVVNYFQQARDESFFEELIKLEGGKAASDSIQAYLEKYGMRCSGEIDITRPRWSEQPTALIPLILSNIRNFLPHAHDALFTARRLEAEKKERELLSRLERLPGGRRKAKKTMKMISRLRNLLGYREYPKYALIQRYFVYKQALMKEAAALVQKGVLREKEDIYYLSYEELREVSNTNKLDYSLIDQRKDEYKTFEKLTPPRVMTSEGEVIFSTYDTGHLPAGALPGLAVSSGVIEGRARVVLKMEEAHIEDGDILVTKFTDPSWTPLFVSIKGLVTEVGGMMTHGAVIAREYGLPAVVAVDDATKLIRDGQIIRIDGSQGYVEILNDSVTR